MLSKKNRLYKEKEINKALKEGKTFFLPEFIIKYYFNTTEEAISLIKTSNFFVELSQVKLSE